MLNFHNQILTFILIFFFSYNHEALSCEIMVCQIEKEIENGKLANKKLFKNKPLTMYFEYDNNWFYEIKNKDWFLRTNEALNNTNFSFKEDSNFFYFNLKTYQSPQKKKNRIEQYNFIRKKKWLFRIFEGIS